MFHFYKNYYWKNGKPYGRELTDSKAETSYKIIVDPYYKRWTVEKYSSGVFNAIIYDSSLLDFRRLKPLDQMAWEREILEQSSESMYCVLRDENHRAILFERHYFEGGRAMKCEVSSIHGILLCYQKIYYKSKNDPFNGVILFDIQGFPVMKKTYEVDEETEQFMQLLTEEWEIANHVQNSVFATE